jgi:hypothetical protein
MRLKERAEEYQYFAERDRELIEKIKQARAVEQESVIRASALSTMRGTTLPTIISWRDDRRVPELPRCLAPEDKIGSGSVPWRKVDAPFR